MNSLSIHLCILHHHRKCFFFCCCCLFAVLSFFFFFLLFFFLKKWGMGEGVHLWSIKWVPSFWQRCPSKSSPVSSGSGYNFSYFAEPSWILSLRCPAPSIKMLGNSSWKWTKRPISMRGGMMTNSLKKIQFTSSHIVHLKWDGRLCSSFAVGRSRWVSFDSCCAVSVNFYELLAAFSLLGELGEDDDEEEGE